MSAFPELDLPFHINTVRAKTPCKLLYMSTADFEGHIKAWQLCAASGGVSADTVYLLQQNSDNRMGARSTKAECCGEEWHA